VLVTDHLLEAAARRAVSVLRDWLPERRRRFDLTRAIQFLATAPERFLDGYEGERQQELRRRHAKHLPGNNASSGILLDGSDLAPLIATRADTVLPGSAGGFLSGTDLMPDYIELARARSVIGAFGATFIGDLVGAASFGRLSGSSIATNWSQTETTTPSDGTQNFSQVTMTPKQVSVVLRESKQLIAQTGAAAQAFIANDLLRAVGQAADVAALSASAGSGAPVGVLDIPGIGSTSGASLANTGVITLQADAAKRLGPFAGYCASVAVAQTMATRLRDSTNTSFYLWEGGLYDGRVAGCRAIASDNVPASTLIFGNWDQLLVGTWGPIFLEISPYGLSAGDFQSGQIALRAILLMDVALRDPQAFAVATGVN
jgi:HK97 family phage major capsid protein